MVFDHWVLFRDDDYKVIAVTLGANPLYGEGSWSIFSGPFSTRAEAEEDAYKLELSLGDE